MAVPSAVAQGPAVTIQVSDCAAPEGGQFVARVLVTSVEDFSAAQYDVIYDPAVLQLTGVTGGELGGSPLGCVEWAWTPGNQTDTGLIRIVADPGEPEPAGPGDLVLAASGEGFLAEMQFTVIGSCGQVSGIGLSDGKIADSEAEDIAATWADSSVVVFKPGDATTDCLVDGRDVIRAKKIILGLESETCGADATQDDTIDGRDVIRIKKMILGVS
jgi:hypothetical protein